MPAPAPFSPIQPLRLRDRRGRWITRYLCSYGGHLHASHRHAEQCNVRLRAARAARPGA